MADQGGLSPRALRLVRRVGEVLPSGPVAVALSGGADSAVLAWAVAQNRQVRAISVDHGLPGSAALMAAAAAIAERLQLPHATVAAAASGTTETALRTTRLAALRSEAREGEVVLTGHTLDDQAETVLGNVLRGTGTAGLAGIPSLRVPFLRPLLGERRASLRAIATELDLPFADDPQNEDLDIRRNLLRKETIPALAERYNPRLVEALGRLGAHAADDEALLADRASRVPLRVTDEAVLIPAAALWGVPQSVAARVARRALRAARGPHAGSASEVSSVLEAVCGSSTTIGGGFQVLREGPWVAVVGPDVAVPAPAEVSTDSRVRFGAWTFAVGDLHPEVGRFRAVIPHGERMVVRAAAAGDRIAIRSGAKRVADALAESGVPLRLRRRWPVVDVDGTIAWIPGVRAADLDSRQATIVVRARRSV